MFAKSIFNSKIRYGIAVYGIPKFDFKLQEQSMDPGLQKIQILQNDMIRLLGNHRRADHVSMKKEREKHKMFSVNQMAVYHVALEMFNVVIKSSAENIRDKVILPDNPHYNMRSRKKEEVRVPRPPPKSCMGFSYTGPKLYNYLPEIFRKTTDKKVYKALLKTWIWEEIPSE